MGATTAAAVKVAGDRVAIGDLGLRSFGGFGGRDGGYGGGDGGSRYSRGGGDSERKW